MRRFDLLAPWTNILNSVILNHTISEPLQALLRYSSIEICVIKKQYIGEVVNGLIEPDGAPCLYVPSILADAPTTR
jgi:hypothetical protein